MDMDVDLSPRLPKKAYEGDGGSYDVWCPKELALLEKADILAAKLVLEKNGLALPTFSYYAMVAYVVGGAGRCGIVLPGATEEKVLPINEGDALALPFGVVTWWFNSSGTELEVLFFGDTSKVRKDDLFIDFQITGSNGICTGFTPVLSPIECCIVRVKDGQKIPESCPKAREDIVLNCLEVPLDVDFKDGCKVVVLNTDNFPLVGKVGLGACLVRIDGSSMFPPTLCSDFVYQVTYIVRGSGRVQIVSDNGKRVLDARVNSGCLFIVPRFFIVTKIADAEGMDSFSVIATPNPIFRQLALAFVPTFYDIAIPEIEKLFGSKRTSNETFFVSPK